jgi:3',5'-cyclic AMP phosphodiesterase CpdA
MTQQFCTHPVLRRRMTLAVGLLIAVMSMTLPLAAAQGAETQQAAASASARRPEPYAPAASPDRIVLNWCGDPSTTMAVTWRTSPEVGKGFAEISLAEQGQRFYQERNGSEYKMITFENGLQRVQAQTTLFESHGPRCCYHVARFEGLSPGTRYVYRVGDGANWSEWFQFRTAGREPTPFRFICFGDSQDFLKPMWSWVFRAAILAAPDAAFTLHAGDLTTSRGNDVEWGEWFAAAGWVNAMVPVVVTPGNHDYFKTAPDGSPGTYLEPHWRAQFPLPETGPAGLEESCYFIDYQGVRIVALDSNVRREEQAQWLDQTLSANSAHWVIVTCHHPAYSVANNRSGGVRTQWQPVFDKHDVDLVLTGHDHAYSRTGLVRAGKDSTPVPGHGKGTVYVVSMSGPKMNWPTVGAGEPTGFAKREAEDTQFFQIISIDGDRLRYEAWTATGVLYDAFTLLKDAQRKKELIEQIPDTPSRRRGQPGSASGPDRGAVLLTPER